MLKAIQILGSSSSSSCTIGCLSLPYRLNKSHSKFYFRPVYGIASKFINTNSLGYQSRKGCSIFGAFQMSHSVSDGPSVSLPQSTTSNAIQSARTRKINFCQRCGGATKHEIPVGEEKMRAICTLCGKVIYENPKMIVGCLIEHENKILLCKRNIEPSFGLWTLPAGYMEIGESACDGAVRETHEEANAEVEILSPFAQLDIPLIGQTYMIFLAKLKKPEFSPGPESSECRLFAPEEIPFDSLAFSSMLVTLKLYTEDIESRGPKFHYGVINKRPGTGPSDIHAYSLDHHFKC